MPITQTPRLGLNQWSSGSDPFTRAQFNVDNAALESLAAIFVQDVYANRPGAGVAGRFFWATDRKKLYYDDGAIWTEAGSLPSGTVLMTAAAAIPAGWLECNGAAVSRATYAELWNALGAAGSVWGLGDGSTTFNVPDFRDRAPAGVGTTVAENEAELIGGHTHADAGHTHGNNLGVNANNFNTGDQSADHNHGNTGAGGVDHTHGFAGGVSTFGVSNTHVHDYVRGTDISQPGTTVGQDVDHTHSLAGITTGGKSSGGADHWHGTGGASANHSHNANHGHSLSGGVSSGTANPATVAATPVRGIRFIIKT